MSEVTLITGPTVEPIDLATAKLWLRIDVADDDAAVTALIKSARQQVEADTGRRLITQTWEWLIDQAWREATINGAVESDLHGFIDQFERPWSSSLPWRTSEQRIQSPIRPLQAVTALSYRLGGQDVDYDVALLRVTPEGMIIFPVSAPFPISDERYAAVKVTLRAGYGDAATAVPDWALQAMRFLIVHWYENREPTMQGRRGIGVELPLTYRSVIENTRVVSI